MYTKADLGSTVCEVVALFDDDRSRHFLGMLVLLAHGRVLLGVDALTIMRTRSDALWSSRPLPEPS